MEKIYAINNLEFDQDLIISTGLNKMSKSWKKQSIKYSELLRKFSQRNETKETAAQYKVMGKEARDKIKDVGGFVGGPLKTGRRSAATLTNRSIISLDLDSVTSTTLWQDIQDTYDFGCCIYSTHSHTPENQRYRLIIPLSEPVFSGEYEAISRMIAEMLGIDQFDDTTYEPSRLMYWPSSSDGGEYIFELQDEKFLVPQDILDKYDDWADQTKWPVSSRCGAKEKKRCVDKAEDPTTKKGIIGEFCRTYDPHGAIAEFLSDVYTPSLRYSDRYTFINGSTTDGLRVYDDGGTTSTHSTDPACGSHNAWDLVRIHKFGDSNTKMIEMANNDKNVLKLKDAEAREDFEAIVDPTHWEESLIRVKGKVKSCPKNFLLIMANDETLKNRFSFNEYSRELHIIDSLSWRKAEDLSDWADDDDSCLRNYISVRWGIDSKNYCGDAFAEIRKKHSYHPVKDYFEGLTWDGVQRVDKLLIDYFGCPDDKYSKFIIRKWLVAGVTRIYKPGTKFDNMIILSGATDIGKSSFFSNIAGAEWFTDSLKATDDKVVMEVMAGKFIAEFGELAGMRKSDAEVIKHFLTKQEFNARLAFGHRATRNPIQWIYAGTTNSSEFLKDKTGNRRFWPIDVFKGNKSVFTDLIRERDQIWAETCHLYREGENINLTDAEKILAAAMQETHMEIDELEQLLEDRLAWDTPEDQWGEYKYSEIVSSLGLSDRLRSYAKQNLKMILEKKGILRHIKNNGTFYKIPPILMTKQISDFNPIL